MDKKLLCMFCIKNVVLNIHIEYLRKVCGFVQCNTHSCGLEIV